MTPRKGETPEEFRARLRARYAAADPEYRERRLARQPEQGRRRYATDAVYREELLKRQRERYETDPEYRQHSGTGAETLRQEDERVEPVSGLGAARPFPRPMDNRDQYSTCRTKLRCLW